MNDDDVYPFEMDETPDLDDAVADALLAGGGSEAEPRLADLLGDVKVAYTSDPPAVGADLAAFVGVTEPVETPAQRRFERVRASMLAKCGAALAVVVAGASGLAVAGALPAPVQNAFSTVGVGSPHHHGPKVETTSAADTTTTSVDSSSLTTVAKRGSTPTTVNQHPVDHGAVSGPTQHDDNEGCDHGSAVGQPCKNTVTTEPGRTKLPVASDGHPGQGQDEHGGNHDEEHDNGKHSGSNGGSEDDKHATSTSVPHDNGHHNGDQGSGNENDD